MASDHGGNELLIIEGAMSGRTLIPAGTPLSRLNYFNGKFLRAEDFALEQKYLLELARHSNRGLGGGVVYGFDIELAGGDTLRLGPGLAVEPAGNLILLPQGVTLSIGELIEATRQRLRSPSSEGGGVAMSGFGDCVELLAPLPGTVLPPAELYVITICRAEALCGQEDVYGKLCEETCVTSTDRSFRKEGLVVRALPLQLASPLPTSAQVAIDAAKFLRSRVAHAWFEDERRSHPDAISSAGLRSDVWCHGSLYDARCCDVPLAVLDRTGNVTTWLDPWTVRRERMDAPAKRYWQWKMRMRPWDVFLAQVLQFQCHLAHVLAEQGATEGQDPCKPQREVLEEAAKFLEKLDRELVARPPQGTDGAALLGLSFTQLASMRSRVESALKAAFIPGRVSERILIQGGIVELPPGGYLPVVPTAELPVNAQVRALLGDGLDYRFCIVRPDYVAHALEEVQHMDRISLLEGLDDPSRKPRVDVLVPDGQLIRDPTPPDARLYRAVMTASTEQTGGFVYKGTAREEALATGGAALYVGAAGLSERIVERLARAMQPGKAARPTIPSLDPNLERSRFVRRDPTGSVGFERLLRTRAAEARTFGVSKAARRGVRAPARALVTRAEAETVDGFWLEASTEKAPRGLPRFGSSPVHIRGVFCHFQERPSSTAVELRGVLTMTDVDGQADGTRVIQGVVNGQLSLESVMELASPPRDEQRVVHQSLDLEVKLTFPPDALDGSATLDVKTAAGANGTRTVFQVKRTVTTLPLAAEYAVSIGVEREGRVELIPWMKLSLTGDRDVVRASNPYHQLAVQGLDLIHAALDVVEPAFKETALARLFPRLPPPTEELIIRAVHDWVLFHRRREKLCTGELAPVEVRPPRSYRIFNFTVANEDEARSLADGLREPGRLAAVIARLSQGPVLLISYEGGTASPLYDATAAARDWERMGVGERIVFAIYGAIDEDDASLQTARVDEFERVVRVHSEEAPGIVEVPVAPLPLAAKPPDADGVMLFITMRAVECQTLYEFPLAGRDNEPDLRGWEQFLAQLSQLTLAEIEKILDGRGARVLGTAEFRGGTDALLPGALDEVVPELAGRRVLAMTLWDRGPDPDLAVRRPQAEAVRRALGVNVDILERTREDGLLGECASVLFLLTDRRLERDVLLFVANEQTPEFHSQIQSRERGQGRFLGADNLDPAGTDWLRLIAPIQRVLRMTLATVAGPPDAQAQRRVEAAAKVVRDANRADPGLVPVVTALSRHDRLLLEQQGVALDDIEDVIFVVG
jgi:hypothetical protein